MVALGGVTSGQFALPHARSGQASNGATPNVTADQVSDQAAQAGISQAAADLASDQAPRGTPAAIAADHQAVKAAEAAAQEAAAKLKADQAQTAGLNLLA